MNIHISPEESQLFLEFCQNRVKQLEIEINERTTKIKSILRLIDSVDEVDEEPSGHTESEANDTSTVLVDQRVLNNTQENQTTGDVISPQPNRVVIPREKRGPYKRKDKTAVVEKPVQNKLIKSIKEASKLRSFQEDEKPKKIERPPAVYSNNKSKYPELEGAF